MTEARGFTDEQYRIALDHRTTIGQAHGMLMERFALDARQAFQQLVSASQDSNIKVCCRQRTGCFPRLELPGAGNSRRM
jgi:hypothetical protein